jgi:hypothetical protein
MWGGGAREGRSLIIWRPLIWRVAGPLSPPPSPHSASSTASPSQARPHSGATFTCIGRGPVTAESRRRTGWRATIYADRPERAPATKRKPPRRKARRGLRVFNVDAAVNHRGPTASACFAARLGGRAGGGPPADLGASRGRGRRPDRESLPAGIDPCGRFHRSRRSAGRRAARRIPPRPRGIPDRGAPGPSRA